MTDRDLSAEIVAALTTGEHTMLAIARNVRARNQDVIDHVRVLEAAGRVYQAEGADGRIVYGLPAAATGRSGNSPTDADRLLAVLSDGRAHSHLELYALGMIVHSRVADLRKRGHEIRHWQESHPNGRRHYYQLLSGPLTKEEGSDVPAGSSSFVNGAAVQAAGARPASSPAPGLSSERGHAHTSRRGRASRATSSHQLTLDTGRAA